eukprot:CAMPEP_0170167400 /NCGR_PEP_ID=MMETSP0040_2-20121228/816_1 /TAXON_ID=641309 /ORGANISM="Lotharella oceanica, Strain CCMP622" /LENGTH=74 /DNA_ID=CAMNT_0010405405 /DNA_START=474 /DNA_END=698 /DNA_ORIENTATION=+
MEIEYSSIGQKDSKETIAQSALGQDTISSMTQDLHEDLDLGPLPPPPKLTRQRGFYWSHTSHCPFNSWNDTMEQ